MEFENDVDIPDYSHNTQLGVVLDGEKDNYKWKGPTYVDFTQEGYCFVRMTDKNQQPYSTRLIKSN